MTDPVLRGFPLVDVPHVDKPVPWTTGRRPGRNDPVTGPSGAGRTVSSRGRRAIPLRHSAVLPRRGDGAEESRVTMGATMVWPTVTLLGFFLFTAVVVALGTSSTARYEFERNGARQPQAAPAPAPSSAHPAGRRAPGRAAGAPEGQPQTVDVAVRPAPAPSAGGSSWWLVDDSASVVAGPFADRIDADWAALSGELAAVSVFGARRTDGVIALRPSPEERAWLGELGEQLDRLPDDWDELLSDTDPLTTLVVEIAATLVEAGLPLYDAAHGSPAGGICLVPEPVAQGVVVSWRTHDRMSLHQLRGAAADATVQQSMNLAVADVLANLGFVLEPFGATGSSLVTALS
jgi:hypothetical protein